MDTKHLTHKSSFGARFTALMLVFLLMLLALPLASVSAAPRALPAVDGDGAMTVSPTSVAYGSTGNTLTFTFSPTGGRDFETGSSVMLTIPAGWPAPVMLSNVFVSEGTCSLNPSWTIVGSTITIDVWSCLSGQSFTITYSGVTAPGFSGSPYTFLTETDVPGGNGTFPIASSPTVSITKAPLTVSAAGLTPANKVYNGDTTATLTIGSPTLVGVIGLDDVSLVTTGATGTFVDENVGTAKTVNISGLTLGGTNAGNYTLTQPTRTANITARPITITAAAGQTKVFGAADPIYSYNASEPLILGNSFSGALNRAAGENVGTYAIGQGTLSAGTNYAITFVSSNFSITAKPITVTATAGQSKVFGAADPVFAYTSSDPGASFTGALTRVIGENVGAYAIEQGTLAVVGLNYTMSFVPNNFTITAKPVTVTATAGQSKVFGAADPVFAYTSSDPGASFTGTLTRVVGENVGAYAIEQGTLAVVGLNYTMSFVPNNFSITAKPIAVTATAGQSKVFGAADPTFAYISSDPGASFTGALNRAIGENVGTYAIGQGTLSAGLNYSILFVSSDFTITAKPITVTADAGQTKVFGSADPAAFTYASSDLGASFTGALNRAAGENVGIYAIGQGTLSAGANYAITFVGSNFTITAKPITVTATAGQSKVFGAADPVFAYTSSDPGASFSGSLTRVVGENVGAYAIEQGSLAVVGLNYSMSFVSNNFTITAKPITVTATAGQSKIFGAADPVFAYTSSDPGASFTGTLTRVAGESVGTYAIEQGTLAVVGLNYTMSFVSNDFTITGKPITVTADAGQTKVFGSADPVAFTYVSSDLGASFTGALNRAAGENVGTYAIGQGTLSAGANYDITFVTSDFTITAKPITVTADAGQTKVFGSADPAAFTYASSDLGASFTGALNRAAGENVGTYAIGQGTLSAGANYAITFVGNNFTITAKPITVTADAGQTKVYGTVDPALTYVSSDLAAVFTGALGRAAGENVGGAYTINQGTLSAGTNYTISFTGSNFAITPASLTATANNKLIVYGSVDPVFDITYTGFQFTDDASVLDVVPTCGVSGPHAVVGTYPIVCSGGSDSNYIITHVDGTLTVSLPASPIFADVPLNYWAISFIERLYGSGITGGCSTIPLNYCPGASVTRAQMAIFLLRGIHGASYTPPAVGAGTGFTDVPVDHPAAAWIKQLAAEGITGGCGVGIYCPDAVVTRAQMAIFLLRAKYTSSYTPPPATGVFVDVPISHPAAAWIEQLAAEGITGGCGVDTYCPDNNVTRDQMAIFLVRTFSLP